MINPRLFPSFLIAAALAVLLLTAARADENTSTIKFSNPAQPGTLRVSITNGDLQIRGADVSEITVQTELKPEEPAQRKDGLRVLTSSTSYSLTEKDNVVTLSYGRGGWPGNNGDFDITVPRNTNVVVSNALGGDIRIQDLTSSIEIKSLNGEVHLDGIAGAALVETMNGEIEASVRSLAEGKPLSFTSMNGKVTLRLPADSKANVRLRTHNGSILTDFDETQLITKTASLKRGDSHRTDDVDANEIRAAVREAVRAGVEAAREAARGAREAIREAQIKAGENMNENEEENEEGIPPIPPMAPLPPMTGGKIVTGTLNGGGPEILVTTMNGDVTLRKAE
jgi:hypothetical protein